MGELSCSRNSALPFPSPESANENWTAAATPYAARCALSRWKDGCCMTGDSWVVPTGIPIQQLAVTPRFLLLRITREMCTWVLRATTGRQRSQTFV